MHGRIHTKHLNSGCFWGVRPQGGVEIDDFKFELHIFYINIFIYLQFYLYESVHVHS